VCINFANEFPLDISYHVTISIVNGRHNSTAQGMTRQIIDAWTREAGEVLGIEGELDDFTSM
jgi:hypothetical protein